MSISPSSDLIVDVLRAAKPSQAHQASQKLAKLSGSAEAGEEFKALISASGAPPRATGRFNVDMAMVNMKNHSAGVMTRTHSANSAKNTATEFEAAVLKNFVELMMPKNSKAIYGGGTAGGMWRSMLAEKIAGELADAGGIGIAKQVFGKNLAADKGDKS